MDAVYLADILQYTGLEDECELYNHKGNNGQRPKRSPRPGH